MSEAKDPNAPGSGITYTNLVKKLRENTLAEFKQQLTQHRFKPKQIDDMSAGFNDGMTAMLRHLRGMGVINVIDEPKKEGE